jgi:hypothetical protein
MSACKQELDELDVAMWELHEAVKAFGESNLGGIERPHVVVDRTHNGRLVGQWVWLDLKIFSRKKPATTKLGKPGCTLTPDQWKAGRDKYLKDPPQGKEPKNEEQLDDLIEAIVKVQELNRPSVQTPVSQLKVKPHDSDDSDGTEDGKSTKVSIKNESLESSFPSTAGTGGDD